MECSLHFLEKSKSKLFCPSICKLIIKVAMCWIWAEIIKARISVWIFRIRYKLNWRQLGNPQNWKNEMSFLRSEPPEKQMGFHKIMANNSPGDLCYKGKPMLRHAHYLLQGFQATPVKTGLSTEELTPLDPWHNYFATTQIKNNLTTL